MNLAKYINDVSALQIFQLMRFTVLILIGILLVKFGYDKEEIGFYELFFFLANVVTFFWTMGIKNALVSYFPSLPSEEKQSLFFNVAILLLVLGLLAALLLFIFQDYVAYLINENREIQHLPFIIAYLILSAPANFTEYFYLLQKKSKQIVSYGVVIFGLQLILLSIGMYLGYDIRGLVIMMVAWAALKFIWLIVVLLRNSNFHFDFRLQQTFLLFSLPLILHMLLGNGMEYVDGFIVNYFFDEGTFAQFRYGARELPLVTILAGALSTAMIPLAVTQMQNALVEIKKKVRKLMNTLFPLSILLILISPIIFPIIYSEEFTISARLFNIYLLIISSRLLMPQVILFARRDTIFLGLSAFIELIINVSLSLILLNYFGLLGIAWATVIAYQINKIMLVVYATVKYKIDISDYLNIKLYGTWFLLLIFSYYISTLYH